MNDRSLIVEPISAEAWLVRNGYEQAQIFVRHGQHEPTRWWVSVSIMSSFGNWGYHWNACGCEWHCFLGGITRDYAMGKFMGTAQYQDDIEKTVKAARETVVDGRRNGWISKGKAREAFDDIRRFDGAGIHEFVEAMSKTEVFRDDYWEMVRKIEAPSGVEFWRQIWEPWIAAVTRGAMRR